MKGSSCCRLPTVKDVSLLNPELVASRKESDACPTENAAYDHVGDGEMVELYELGCAGKDWESRGPTAARLDTGPGLAGFLPFRESNRIGWPRLSFEGE